MSIGNCIPVLQLRPGTHRKTLFEEFSEQVLSHVRNLLTPEDSSLAVKIKNERFGLNITLHNSEGKKLKIPDELRIKHAPALAKFLHRPAILKIFKVNLGLPIDPLQNLE